MYGTERSGIEPRIPGVSMRALSLKNLGVVIVIHIPRSWVSPHRISFQEWSRFYSRNSAGKYPLDVSELRAAFAMSETKAERIRNFHIERLSRIAAGETPVALTGNAKLCFHIIPFGAFDPVAKFDLTVLLARSRVSADLRPLNSRGWSTRHNFDGFLVYSQIETGLSYSYLQVFRSGIIEAVNTSLFREREDKRFIYGTAYERELLEALPRLLSIQKQIGVEPPLFVMLSLLGVQGYTMGVDRSQYRSDEVYPIERDVLNIPEVVVEDFDCDPAKTMKPVFDAIWNAAGLPRSMNYDESGNWIRQ